MVRALCQLLMPALAHHELDSFQIKEATYFGDRFIISGSDDGHIYFWDRFTGELVHILKVSSSRKHFLDPNSCCESPMSGTG